MNRLISLLKAFWFVIALVLIVVLATGGYALGFRISGLGLAQVGTLVIRDMPQETYVFTDQAKRTVVNAKGEVHIKLTPGSHTVIVDAPGMQPWNELFEITSNTDSVLSPILAPEEFSAGLLLGEKKTEAINALWSLKLPTKTAPLSMANGCANVYVEGNRVLASANATSTCAVPDYLTCAPEGVATSGECPATIIFPASDIVTSVIPFPGRSDALIINAGKLSFILELDPRDPRFVAPVAKGSVRIAPATDSSLYMTNSTDYYEIPI